MDPLDGGSYEQTHRITTPADERWLEVKGLIFSEGEGEKRHASTYTGIERDWVDTYARGV